MIFFYGKSNYVKDLLRHVLMSSAFLLNKFQRTIAIVKWLARSKPPRLIGKEPYSGEQPARLLSPPDALSLASFGDSAKSARSFC